MMITAAIGPITAPEIHDLVGDGIRAGDGVGVGLIGLAEMVKVVTDGVKAA